MQDNADVGFERLDLENLAIFHGLPEEQLDWFCLKGQRVELQTGDHMFERGDPATALWVVVRGVIQGFEEIGGEWLLVATTVAGEVTGMLPFSRMTHYPRHTVAAEPSLVLRLDAKLFREMLDVSHELVQRLVAEMSDRVRGDVRLEQQGEKMMALGRLSAGLAHELNNPATAITRASARLSEHRAKLPALVAALAGRRLSAEVLGGLEKLRRSAVVDEPNRLSAMERGQLEEELSEWLEVRGVGGAWEMAPTFADVGLRVENLAGATEDVPEEALEDVVAWLAGGIESDRMVVEINAAAGRISGLVASIKTYSHMDRSQDHKPTDVRAGLDNTLTMLGHKLKARAVVMAREYEEGLPLIPANAGELNQVWTNLIDNAIDAMGDEGRLTLRAQRNDLWVEVEIEDDGPGIPPELRSVIFEPFFTTKEVGVGTGLGLGIAQRIVKTHQGHIEVRSRPGETVMCVRLPIERSSPLRPSTPNGPLAPAEE
jgi:signal transduction histidine kinase